MIDHDAVVVGAGPAGSMTALTILMENPEKKVLLVDRREKIGVPVQCAGGIVMDRLEPLDLPPIPEEVIATPLRGAILHGPHGSSARWDGGRTRGYIVHRDRFDQWLVDMACVAGAELRREDPATTVPAYDYSTRYLVGADGWASLLGQHFFFDPKQIKLGTDFHLGVQYLVNLEHPTDPEYAHLYFGNEVAPGGYVWVFPESAHYVRVGCGTSPGHKPRAYLDRFLGTSVWGGEILGVNAGGIIPTAKPVQSLYREVMRSIYGMQKVVLVGDAARMCDPVHGGGISNAMVAAKKLGEVIAEDGDLVDYGIWFKKGMRKELERRYLLKQVMAKWNDKDLEAMVEVMASCEVRDDVPVNQLVRDLVLKLAVKKPLLFPKSLGAAIGSKFRS